MLTLHELVIDGNHAWVTANKNVPRDLSKYGGAYNGALIDSAVQEYDLKTGALERNWDALDHIPLSQSQASLPTNGFPWDAYHINSIQLTGNGEFLVSMRDTWAAYLVDIASSKIQWTLGGRNSSFKFGPGAGFEWQHDVSMQNDSTVSVFDDHCCRLTGGGTSVDPTGPSRGLVLRLDQQTRKATLAAQYGNHGRLSLRIHGRHPAAGQRRRVRRLGLGTVLLRVRPHRASCCSKASCPVPTSVLPGDAASSWVGLPLSTAARRGARGRRQDVRLRELERRDRARLLAGARRLGRRAADRRWQLHAKAGFETAIPLSQASGSFAAAGAGRRRARDRESRAFAPGSACASGPRRPRAG